MSSGVQLSQATLTHSDKIVWTCLVSACAAIAIAAVIWLLQMQAYADSEKAVIRTMIALAIALAGAAGIACLRFRRQPALAAVAILASAATVLVGIYMFCISSAVLFPADILIWSESDFVNDILKIRTGYPLYGPDVNNDSFCYPFATQMLTWVLAGIAGFQGSIPAWRTVQVLFTSGAAFVSVLCCRRIVRMTAPQARIGLLWPALWFPGLFLIATNPVTNGFVHNLHNDALAQLVSVVAFYLLLRYTETRSTPLLIAMAILPAAGLLVKQSLLLWGGLFAAWLLLFDRPVSLRRTALFIGFTAILVAVVIGVCFAIWGYPFYYWIFVVLGKHGVSPLRSFQHLLATWPFVVAGLFGGWALFRGEHRRGLFGAWLLSLVLIVLQIWTSGIAWMLNHIGPGCLLAGIWFFAALAVIWQKFETGPVLEPALVASMVLLSFAGMGLIRIPLPAIPADAARYAAAIEKHVAAAPGDRVLLDVGTWVYLPKGIVMKDRAPSIGERGWSQTGDFSGVLGRIRSRHYETILVRNYESGDFWYDHASWRKSSGIRAALADNYDIAGVIPAVDEAGGRQLSYLFAPVTILTAKSAGAASSRHEQIPQRTVPTGAPAQEGGLN